MSWLYKVIKNSQISYDTEKPYFIGISCDNSSNTTNLAIDETIVKDRISNNIKQKVLELKMQKADVILNEAKETAKDIIKKAQIEAERIMTLKEQEGFKNGMEMANMKYLKAVEDMEYLKKNLKAEYEKKINSIEEQILDLSIALAKRIVDIEIDQNEQAVLLALKDVMEKVDIDDEMIIEMSQDNIYKINKLQPKHNYKLKVNNRLGKTGILLNSKNGIIDVSLDKQFENLKSSLYEMKITS